MSVKSNGKVTCICSGSDHGGVAPVRLSFLQIATINSGYIIKRQLFKRISQIPKQAETAGNLILEIRNYTESDPYVYPNVHHSTIYNSLDMEATYMSIDR